MRVHDFIKRADKLAFSLGESKKEKELTKTIFLLTGMLGYHHAVSGVYCSDAKQLASSKKIDKETFDNLYSIHFGDMK